MSILAIKNTRAPMPIYVPDIINENVERVSKTLGRKIFFEVGREADVTKVLTDKTGAKMDKWPLVWLVGDFEIKRSQADIYGRLNSLNIIIATGTQPGLSVMQRREQTFMPTLYPIYAELIKEFSEDPKLRKRPLISHTVVDRHYWDGGVKGANMLGNFIDAVQIKDLVLEVAKNIGNCF